MKRIAAAVTVMLFIMGVAYADRLILKSGQVFTGKVRIKGAKVEVSGEFGRLEFNSSEVRTIITELLPSEVYREKAADIHHNDKAGHLELADWCAKNNLEKEENFHLFHALRITPEDENLRRRLGFKRYEGRWMTEAQIMKNRGLIQYRGEWMKPEEKARIISEEKETSRREKEEKKAAREKERLDEKRLADLRKAFDDVNDDRETLTRGNPGRPYLPPWYSTMYYEYKRKRSRFLK